ncbi:hypothetical protein ABPG75_003212 [Micractinium tetrahymenae]
MTCLYAAVARAKLTYLQRAIDAAGLKDVLLNSTLEATLLAPTNDAFRDPFDDECQLAVGHDDWDDHEWEHGHKDDDSWEHGHRDDDSWQDSHKDDHSEDHEDDKGDDWQEDRHRRLLDDDDDDDDDDDRRPRPGTAAARAAAARRAAALARARAAAAARRRRAALARARARAAFCRRHPRACRRGDDDDKRRRLLADHSDEHSDDHSDDHDDDKHKPHPSPSPPRHPAPSPPHHPAHPSDKCFEALLADTKLLAEVLQYHVIPGVVNTTAWPAAGGSETVPALLEGTTLELRKSAAVGPLGEEYEDYRIVAGQTDAKIVLGDLPVGAGLLHIIDDVLLP